MMHPPCKLVVMMEVEHSKGYGGEDCANCGDIGEAGPSTPRHVAGSIAKGFATLPRAATTLKGKGKGKVKAREEEEEEEFEVSLGSVTNP
ncbi:hypothetical protein C0989_001958 [Termitomyces sp. Mn162]|nr:hypothetical protein C0989_001958 [Termitomyces sp. Mn162]